MLLFYIEKYPNQKGEHLCQNQKKYICRLSS